MNNRQAERSPRRRCTELVEEGEVIARPGEVVRVQPGEDDVTVILPEPSVANDGQDVVVSFEGDGTAAGKVLVVPMAGTCGKPGVTTLNSPGSYHFTSTGGAVPKRQNAAVPTDPGAPTSSPGWSGPGDIVTDDLPDDGVTNDKLDEMPGNSVKVNATATEANPTDLVIPVNTVLGRKAGNVVAETIATAQIGDDQVTDGKLRNSAAVSVIGRSANSSGDPADIAAAANDRVLARSSNTLAFQQVSTDMIADDAVTDAKLRESAALSVIGRSANSTGNPADISAGTDGHVLRRSGTTLAFGTLAVSALPAGVITATGTVNAAALGSTTTGIETSGNLTLNGISGGFAGREVAVYCGGNHTLTVTHNSGSAAAGDQILLTNALNYGPATRGGMRLRHDGTAWREVARGGLEDDVVTDLKLRNSAALSVIGRSANSSGDPADISTTSSSAAVLRESGGVLGFGTVATAGITDDAVTDGKLRNSAALSVIGRSANSSGDPADIAAANDAEVLRRSGTTLGFGTVATAGLADDSVTDAKLRESAACSVIGRSANSSGNPADITGGTNDRVLARESNALAFTQVSSGMLADDAVTDAKLRESTALSVIGRSANSTGNPADISAGTDGHVLRRSGTALAFGTLAVSALPAGSITATGTVNAAALSTDTTGIVTSGNLTLNGISGGFAGRVIDVHTGGNHTLTVTHNSGSAAAGDAILLANAVNYGPVTRGGIRLRHDGSAWREVSRSGLGDGEVTTAKILDANVTLAKMASLAESRIIGRAEGAGTGVPQALTPTQVVSIIDGESPQWTAVHRFDSYIQFGTSTGLPVTGDIRKAASLRLESGASVQLVPTDTLSLQGSVSMGSTLTVSTAGSIDNLTIGNVSVVRFTNATDVTGMIATTAWQVVWLLNASSNIINLHRESGSSTSSNRWAGSGGSSLIIRPGEMQAAIYDFTSSRWRSISGAV